MEVVAALISGSYNITEYACSVWGNPWNVSQYSQYLDQELNPVSPDSEIGKLTIYSQNATIYSHNRTRKVISKISAYMGA